MHNWQKKNHQFTRKINLFLFKYRLVGSVSLHPHCVSTKSINAAIYVFLILGICVILNLDLCCDAVYGVAHPPEIHSFWVKNPLLKRPSSLQIVLILITKQCWLTKRQLSICETKNEVTAYYVLSIYKTKYWFLLLFLMFLVNRLLPHKCLTLIS